MGFQSEPGGLMLKGEAAVEVDLGGDVVGELGCQGAENGNSFGPVLGQIGVEALGEGLTKVDAVG